MLKHFIMSFIIMDIAMPNSFIGKNFMQMPFCFNFIIIVGTFIDNNTTA